MWADIYVDGLTGSYDNIHSHFCGLKSADVSDVSVSVCVEVILTLCHSSSLLEAFSKTGFHGIWPVNTEHAVSLVGQVGA